jgi:hypothetical protein
MPLITVAHCWPRAPDDAINRPSGSLIAGGRRRRSSGACPAGTRCRAVLGTQADDHARSTTPEPPCCGTVPPNLLARAFRPGQASGACGFVPLQQPHPSYRPALQQGEQTSTGSSGPAREPARTHARFVRLRRWLQPLTPAHPAPAAGSPVESARPRHAPGTPHRTAPGRSPVSTVGSRQPREPLGHCTQTIRLCADTTGGRRPRRTAARRAVMNGGSARGYQETLRAVGW